jgi:membrane protein
VVLVWVYYTSMTVFLGAEFTREWMEARGRPIRPDPGAVHVVKLAEQEPKVSPGN